MSNRQIGKATKLLIEARNLIENEDNWCKHNYTRYCAEKRATQYCAVGALETVAQRGSEFNEALFNLAIGQLYSIAARDITLFNDEASHGEVVELYDKAIARSIKEELSRNVQPANI